MTIFEFFTQNTLSQICEAFNQAGLKRFTQVPSNEQGFCRQLNLELDERCKIHTCKRSGYSEIYVTLTYPNPEFPDTPIHIENEICMTTKNGKCKLGYSRVLDYHENIPIFKDKSDFFDRREGYNTYEYDVWLFNLTDVIEPFVNGLGEDDYRTQKHVTNNLLYEAICQHIKGIAPLIRQFVASTVDGSWEKIWNTFMPRRKWKRGSEQFWEIEFPLMMNDWFRVVKAGVEPVIQNFIKYFGIICVYKDFDKEQRQTIRNWLGKDEDAVSTFNELVKKFEDKYLNNNEMNRWNETYRNANTELISKVQAAIAEVSAKYKINPNHLDYVSISRVRGEINWFHTEIPTDAYLTPSNEE